MLQEIVTCTVSAADHLLPSYQSFGLLLSCVYTWYYTWRWICYVHV